VISRRVPGFLTSTSAWHFANDFPSQPLFRLGVGQASIPVGNASDGLCGGMVFGSRDLFEHGLRPPADRSPPRRGTRLFRYLLGRLFASFDLPVGPLRYWLWQVLPEGDRFAVRGLGWRTIRGHWPAVRADLDGGHPSPLGVVRTRSLNPFRLGRNHQLLAYGYELDDEKGTLTIHVYDPNHPDDDGCSLSLSLADPTRATRIGYVAGEAPIRGFFRTRYRPRDPSAIAGPS